MKRIFANQMIRLWWRNIFVVRTVNFSTIKFRLSWRKFRYIWLNFAILYKNIILNYKHNLNNFFKNGMYFKIFKFCLSWIFPNIFNKKKSKMMKTYCSFHDFLASTTKSDANMWSMFAFYYCSIGLYNPWKQQKQQWRKQ